MEPPDYRVTHSRRFGMTLSAPGKAAPVGREARRKLKSVTEHITNTPEMPKRLAFLLRHPIIGVCVCLCSFPLELACGAWFGTVAAWRKSTAATAVFVALSRGKDAL